MPTPERNVAAVGLRLSGSGQWWLFDCGEGTQHRIQTSPLRLSRLAAVFITHLHGDHIFGLPGLLATRSLQGIDSPLTVFGPPGLTEFLDTVMRLTETRLEYPLDVREVSEGKVWDQDGHVVCCALLRHGVPSFGYRVEEKGK